MYVAHDYGLVRIVHDGSPFVVRYDIRVEVFQDGEWRFYDGYNSLNDDYAFSQANDSAGRAIKEQAALASLEPKQYMQDFLIHFDCGARGDFLYSFLVDKTSKKFLSPSSRHKIHTLYLWKHLQPDEFELENLKKVLSSIDKIKIRISSLANLAQVVYNHILKIPQYPVNNVFNAGIELYNYNMAIVEIYKYYDYIIPFNMLQDIYTLHHIYETINGRQSEQIDAAKSSLSLQKKWSSCDDEIMLRDFQKLNNISQSIDGDISSVFIKNFIK